MAKKPTHLASTSPLTSPSLLDEEPLEQGAAKMMPVQRASTNIQSLTSQLEMSGTRNLTGGMQQRPASTPAQPKWMAGNATGSGRPGGISLPGLGERKPVPPARPRAQGTATHAVPPPKPARKPASIDLLGDEGTGEMSGWETLKPS